MTASAEYLAVVQRTPEWLEARQAGIGASESAAAAGMSRWESPYALWARKCGLVPPPSTTLAMEIGTLTEPVNAARYTEATGMPLRRVNRLMRSRRLPFALTSLDRRRRDGRLVELKWSERAEGYGEPGSDELPDAVACQVTHQMFVTGADCADVSLLTGSKDGIRIYTVRWDPAFGEALMEREADLWRHVEERTAPDVDGSDSTLAALAAVYPREELEEVTTSDPDIAAALAAVLEGREAAKRIAEAEKGLRARLETAQGSAGLLTVPGVGRIRWAGTVKGSVRWKAVAEGLHADLAEREPAVRPLGEIAEAYRGESRRGDWEPSRMAAEEEE